MVPPLAVPPAAEAPLQILPLLAVSALLLLQLLAVSFTELELLSAVSFARLEQPLTETPILLLLVRFCSRSEPTQFTSLNKLVREGQKDYKFLD